MNAIVRPWRVVPWLLAFGVIVVVLALLATPAYQDYTPRARLAEQQMHARLHARALGYDSGYPAKLAGAPLAVPNTEHYDLVRENDFRDALSHPVSTFSIDVDTASYSNVRRFVETGIRPPPDAVRIEELVNYFDYDYPVPRGDAPFTVTTEISLCPWNPGHRLLHVGLKARDVDLGTAPPSNLVFLIDVSGSMRDPRKLPLLKSAFRLLVDQLRDVDRIALVVYAGAAGLVLPSTPGSEKRRILDAIDALEAGGSTAGGAGMRLAYGVARRGFVPRGNNRVLLATDGDFNVGESSDGALVRLVERERESGVRLSVLGFGTGNLKDSRMEKLADNGDGSYAYVDRLSEARKVLVEELGGTLVTVAKDVKAQIEFNPARVDSYRLVGYENRLLSEDAFDDDARDAGDLGAGHTVTALYEIVPADAARASGRERAYQTIRVTDEARASGELAMLAIRHKPPEGGASVLRSVPIRDEPRAASESHRFAAAVAQWGMILRGSKHLGDATLASTLDLARGALGEDRHGHRRGFVELVELTRALPDATTARVTDTSRR